MLVNPDFLAWMHEQVRGARPKGKKAGPMVRRGENITPGDFDKNAPGAAYEGEEREAEAGVEYLNERHTNVSFYA